jgi:hypothetical protein
MDGRRTPLNTPRIAYKPLREYERKGQKITNRSLFANFLTEFLSNARCFKHTFNIPVVHLANIPFYNPLAELAYSIYYSSYGIPTTFLALAPGSPQPTPNVFHRLHRASLPTWQSGIKRRGIGQESEGPFSRSYAGVREHTRSRIKTFMYNLFISIFYAFLIPPTGFNTIYISAQHEQIQVLNYHK